MPGLKQVMLRLALKHSRALQEDVGLDEEKYGEMPGWENERQLCLGHKLWGVVCGGARFCQQHGTLFEDI